MMTTPKNILLSCTLVLTSTLSLGLAGCERDAERGKDVEVEVADDEVDIDNLCKKYESCNDCITGLKAEGDSEDEAETKCTLAVAGCWTTWETPIACGDKTFETKPE